MSIAFESASPAAASRFANPFATCWTRPGALPWLRADGVPPVDTLADRLLERRICQIVGPHGVGKSTLVAALADTLRGRGVTVTCLRCDPPGQRSLAGLRELLRVQVVAVDGFEQLPAFKRLGLIAAATAGAGRLLVTTHRQQCLGFGAGSVLADLRPSLATFRVAFDALTANRPTPVTWHDAQRCYHRHAPNLREAWFELYDLHERLGGL